MTRDIAVLYSRCPWIILWWLWITLNTSNTINDSLYLSKTSEAKSQIFSTNILLTCRTQQTREPHLHLQFSRRRRPTIIIREESTDTSAEEIIYAGHTDANSIIILHLSGIVSQTDIYTVLCGCLIEFHNETRLFVPLQMLMPVWMIHVRQDRRPDSYSEIKFRFVTKPIFLFPYNLILLAAGSIFSSFSLQDYRSFSMIRRPRW